MRRPTCSPRPRALRRRPGRAGFDRRRRRVLKSGSGRGLLARRRGTAPRGVGRGRARTRHARTWIRRLGRRRRWRSARRWLLASSPLFPAIARPGRDRRRAQGCAWQLIGASLILRQLDAGLRKARRLLELLAAAPSHHRSARYQLSVARQSHRPSSLCSRAAASSPQLSRRRRSSRPSTRRTDARACPTRRPSGCGGGALDRRAALRVLRERAGFARARALGGRRRRDRGRVRQIHGWRTRCGDGEGLHGHEQTVRHAVRAMERRTRAASKPLAVATRLVEPRLAFDVSPRNMHVAAKAATRRCALFGRGVEHASPRNIHVAAAASPRPVATEFPRGSRGVAATRRHGISTWSKGLVGDDGVAIR